MRLAIERYWVPKAGSSRAEYEDAFYPGKLTTALVEPPAAAPAATTHWLWRCFLPRRKRVNTGTQHKTSSHREYFAHTNGCRLAVADGATETSFSQLWARILVHFYGRGRLDDCADATLSHCRELWQWHVDQYALPWYSLQKAQQGAFASLLGLHILEPPSANPQGAWNAVAVGDSCLFHLRSGRVLLAFPMTASEDFTSRPTLIPSIAHAHTEDAVVPLFAEGEWAIGDEFLLMTDALACWCMQRCESEGDALERLVSLNGQQAFEALVECERNTASTDGCPALRNDDTTLLRCILEPV